MFVLYPFGLHSLFFDTVAFSPLLKLQLVVNQAIKIISKLFFLTHKNPVVFWRTNIFCLLCKTVLSLFGSCWATYQMLLNKQTSKSSKLPNGFTINERINRLTLKSACFLIKINWNLCQAYFRLVVSWICSCLSVLRTNHQKLFYRLLSYLSLEERFCPSDQLSTPHIASLHSDQGTRIQAQCVSSFLTRHFATFLGIYLPHTKAFSDPQPSDSTARMMKTNWMVLGVSSCFFFP